MYAHVNDDFYIDVTVEDEQYADDSYVEFDFPENFDFTKQSEYKIVDGELIHDPLPPSEEELEYERQQKLNEQIQLAVPMTVQLRSADIPDEQAVKIPLLFKTWTIGETYTKGEIVRYEEDGELYRCGQRELYRCGQPEITASDVYKPGDPGTTALYSHIEISEQGYEVWQKWDGVSGIYKQDQIVQDPYDDNNLYRSKIPNNVWGPPHELPDYWKPYTE